MPNLVSGAGDKLDERLTLLLPVSQSLGARLEQPEARGSV